MKVAVIGLNNANIYPAMYQLARGLSAAGAKTHYVSAIEPRLEEWHRDSVVWVKLPKAEGWLASSLPLLRSNFHGIFQLLSSIGPDWILAQHQFVIPALAYGATARGRGTRVAGYFSDYHKEKWHTHVLRGLSSRLDVYVDICDMRLAWRQRDWPRMRAATFVVKQAPSRDEGLPYASHSGETRVVFTGSSYLFGLDLDRFSRFVSRLCDRGIAFDWYLPEQTAHAQARSLSRHPLYRVLPSIPKPSLLATLGGYDVGLHWAPMAESGKDPQYFASAASNKIGEYIAAGLAVAYAGNPGLAYLREDIRYIYDPTEPEAGADHLANELASRSVLERKRAAAVDYHHSELNFETQASGLIAHLLGEAQAAARLSDAAAGNGALTFEAARRADV